MVEFEYVKGQEKQLEKKYDQLMKQIKSLEKEGDINRIKKKYQLLLDKKKNGEISWTDEELIKVYQDFLKHDLKKL
jgi:hypothetical protein